MTIEDITLMIEEYEHSEPSLSNIRNLSALYNVRTHLKETSNKTASELNDIFPSYLKYIDTKRKYQKGEVSINPVYIDIKHLSEEIKEFISSLYKCTDTQKERDILVNTIKDIP